jgi:hypothetical protein
MLRASTFVALIRAFLSPPTGLYFRLAYPQLALWALFLTPLRGFPKQWLALLDCCFTDFAKLS